MRFVEGTSVFTADGQPVGSIERFVIDPRSRQIVGLVVRRGLLFKTERVIPVDAVASADEHIVALRPDIGSPASFPQFEEMEPRTADTAGHYNDHDPALEGAGQWAVPFNPPAPDTQRRVRNIPAETVPLREGAPVITNAGEHIGDVVKVFTDDRYLKHFVVSHGFLNTEEKLVPGDWVSHLHEDEVVLRVGADMVEELAAYIREDD